MAYFQLKYLGESGGIVSVGIEAETKEQAMAISGIPEAVIHSVTVDHLGGIKAAVLDKKFPLVEQVLMLSAIASKVSSGKTFGKAVQESVNYKALKITYAQIDGCQTPKEYLTLLRFDETAVLLAEAGDKTGRLPDALNRASKAIADRLAAQKEFSALMKKAVINAGFGLAFIVGIPLWAGGTINDFINVQRLDLQLNALSQLIMMLYTVYTQYLYVLVGIIVGVYLFRAHVWEMVRTLPGFSFLNERNKVRMGLEFVQTYQLLLSSGFTNPQSFRFMMQRSKGRAHALYQEAHARLVEGRELSDVFDNPEWPPLITQNLQGFDNQSPAGRDNVLGNMADALKAYYLRHSEKVAQMSSVIGFSMMLLTIMMFAIGFYLPIINLSSAMR
ncbi:type II secretion system F family protein [Pseudomonas sp. V1]|uniref:type II secretion system F family protein n=1 Tax=Pseudomonas arcuscaelestis TaxID=2710591 RepID=UPI00193EE13E|nr:type II secretion system F family protein [Pseudomonas arcuscaelestis]MBM3105724.1 type II secretion system F family protein [Pseudomonas arcuscaelestis]